MTKLTPVAIVGIGGIFPQAPTLDRFWSNIRDRVDAAREPPPGRWLLSMEDAFDAHIAQPDKVYSKRGCFVESFQLDHNGLDIDRKLLDELDPVFHLALHAGRQAWRDAATENLNLRRVGVIIGNIVLPNEYSSRLAHEYLGRTFEEKVRRVHGWAAHSSHFQTSETCGLNRRAAGLPAAVLAKALGLGGGHYTLDAACASSLYALKLAVDELQSGRADAMLTGGLSRPDCLYTQMGFSQLRALSPRGRCSPFDAGADGLIVGEGAGIFVLKRLEDAIRDEDHVYAVIAGIGLSNDVHGKLLAPSSEGQLRALRAAYEQAGWRPQDVDVIECHGTGTPAGDGVELESLRKFWNNFADKNGQTTAGKRVIGSVKSNIGHTLTAAGSAGLLKVLLALGEKTLPPTANFSTPAPALAESEYPFQVLMKHQRWDRREQGRASSIADRESTVPRRAAVSAFGFGGINAHVLLEEWLPSRARGVSPLSRPNASNIVQAQGANVPRSESLIAIVGIGAHFGPWDNRQSFQERTLRARSTSDGAPRFPNHWWGAEKSLWFQEHGFENAMFQGYFIDQVAVAADQFRIPPKELEEMLPQQLLMLMVAAEAIADAQWNESELLQTGVFIGLGLDLNTTNFHLRWSIPNWAREWNQELGSNLSDEDLMVWRRELRDAAGPPLTANRTMGALGAVAASRVAREFHIGGPSFTLSCEENSGLRALAVAVRLLQKGELNQALVGAVDFAGDIRAVLADASVRQGSTVETKPRVVGEGAAAVVLKRLEDAERDGDRVYGIIKEIRAASGEILKPAADEQIANDIGHCGAALGLASLVKTSLGLIHPTVSNEESGLSARHSVLTSGSFDGNCITVVLERAGQQASVSTPPISGSSGQNSASAVSLANKGTDRRVVVTVGGKPFRVPKLPNWAARAKSSNLQKSVKDPDFECSSSAIRLNASSQPPLTVNYKTQRTNFRDESSVSSLALGALIRQVTLAQDAKSAAHQAYLRFSQKLTDTYADQVRFQMTLLHGTKPQHGSQSSQVKLQSSVTSYLSDEASPPTMAFDRSQCLEFAVGSIARVLGPAFADVDSFPTRVRLPDEPLMLVDRIVSIDAEPHSMQPGQIATEHDIRPGDWYLDNNRIPPCIAIESGQADLFLSGYLGIDFQTRGRAVYRLLDAVVTFHRGLPGPGEVIRYDIRIERFFRQGNTWFFRFQFDGSVNGQPLLTMREGCAGFFTAEELQAGRGVVNRSQSQQGIYNDTFETTFVPMAPTNLDARQLEALSAGDLPGCFGRLFADLNVQDPLRLPGGRMKLVHRVTNLDPEGGRYSQGVIRAEADIHPDDWFLTCHFVDDRVMPGTLMYECCLHTLRIYLMRMGWMGEQQEVAWEPIPGVASRLKCRGQVIETTKVAAYEVSIKELGFRPEPYAIADAIMYADGKAIVEITDMTLRLSGMTREKLQSIWGKNSKPEIRNPHGLAEVARPESSKGAEALQAPSHTLRKASERTSHERETNKVLFDHDRILSFAVGKPSEAFGEQYQVFDEGRFIARLPGPPYHFLDRITVIQAEPWKMKPGGIIESQYDVPPGAWYFEANRQPRMPYAVLLEIALQTCGWMAAFMGSALTSPDDLHFRNLGGEALQLAEVTPHSGTLTTTVKITKVSHSAGMIIQHYDFEIQSGNQPVYRGNTYFGFFSPQALAQQIGIRDAAIYRVTDTDRTPSKKMPYPSTQPFPDSRLRMVDNIDLYLPDGGPHGLGLILGSKNVDPEEWFFKAHFFQDPVWPGSLGLEAFVQLLKTAAAERWQVGPDDVFDAIVLGKKHSWVYRGQVLPTNRSVSIQAELTAVDDAQRRVEADGFLSVDGRIIYHMTGFSVGLRTGT